MPIPKGFYDRDGNEVSLNKLCRLEPDWAANQIKTLHKQYDELQNAIKRDIEMLKGRDI